MTRQWWDVSTYNHILFVPFIVGWLVWNRREVLAGLSPSAWWPGLMMLGGSLFLWLLGRLSGFDFASQLGAVLALQSAVAVLFGPRVVAALLFPLGYMLFLVPFGDELVPVLQTITAEIVIVLVGLSGTPAVINGVFIDTPVGLFEVAEACSGVKFLVAMLALGVLVAHTCFHGWKRRTLFLAACLALPIMANGVRAWGTIYIAQSQGIAFAEGFDHVFYGWVFFALVVAALLVGAWRWFDRLPEELGVDAAELNASSFLSKLADKRLSANGALLTLLTAIIAFASWQTVASRAEASMPVALELPPIPGWERIPFEPVNTWLPRAGGADRHLLASYHNANGQQVDVSLAIYAAQGEDRDASAVGEGALVPDTPWRWLEPGPASDGSRAEFLLANGTVKRFAQTSYRTGGLTTGSVARLKLAIMRDRAFVRRRPVMTLILSSREQDGIEPVDAVVKLREAMGDAGEWMDRAAGLR